MTSILGIFIIVLPSVLVNTFFAKFSLQRKRGYVFKQDISSNNILNKTKTVIVKYDDRFGADDETRTRDLILTKDVRYHLCHISIFGRGRRTGTLGTWFWRQLLYQLSYTPISLRYKWWAFRDSNPGPTGYEPVALTN